MTPVSCKCKRPFIKGDLPFGCGQCLPCRIRRRRRWVHRLSLENRLHGDSAFITLTYDPKKETFPKGGSLVPKDLTDWLKRLRRNFTTNPIRYFAVGEYGEVSQHPHFHAILFGFPTCTGARCQDKNPRYACQACQIIRSTWDRGHIYNGDVTKDSLSYVAGYVTKGLTQSNDYTEKILQGRAPEFSRMSLRPGIGAGAAVKIAESLSSVSTFSEAFFGATSDVPSILLTDQKLQPVDRYLKAVMRKTLGWAEPQKSPTGALDGFKKEMSELFQEHFKDAPFAPDRFQKKMLLTELSRDAIINIEAKFKKYNLRGAL